MTNLYLSTIRATIKSFPAVVPHLKGRARWVAFSAHPKQTKDNGVKAYLNTYIFRDVITKTYDYFLSNLERLVTSVYNGNIAGEFIDIMANLISGQLTQAFEQAYADEGGEDALPDYLTSAVEEMILGQYEHVDQYYRDIQDARIDKTSIDPLLSRAALWAQRWTEAYNQAMLLIRKEEGGNLEWVLGETEEHCTSCAALNGIVARASEWDTLNVHPQGAPNDHLECGGWKCDCSLQPTDKRRSAGAYGRIEEAIL